MPDYIVGFTGKAKRDLDAIPDDEADNILKACLRLERNPFPEGKHIKKLRGFRDLYRLRVGDYRVIFKWEGNTVTVIRLLTRQDFGKRY